jgi:hypothetical protein
MGFFWMIYSDGGIDGGDAKAEIRLGIGIIAAVNGGLVLRGLRQ